MDPEEGPRGGGSPLVLGRTGLSCDVWLVVGLLVVAIHGRV